MVAISFRPQWVKIILKATHFGSLVLFLPVNIKAAHAGKRQPADIENNSDCKVHGANMGPTWVLLAPDRSRVGPMNLVIREYMEPA